MKKILSLLLALAVAITPSFVFADEEISVFVDSNKVVFDQNPIIENGRTLVPLRAIFEALGAYVEWNGDTNTVVAKKGLTTIVLQIGSNRIYKTTPSTANYFDIDVPASLINSRTLVPVRAISEALGAKVGWDGTTKTVSIESENRNILNLFRTHENKKLKEDGNIEVVYYEMFMDYPQIEGYDKANESIKNLFEEKFKDVIRRKDAESVVDYDGSLLYGWMFMPHNYELLVSVESIENGKITLVGYEIDYNGAISPTENEIRYVIDAQTGNILN
ncbi:MAG: copper amine oxidase N-terminal domain-containing protein [Ruminococcaceae bacterium]|nr:copper amine oxidase N-terminal domain-containing protein [Oscillospiraceae bacterium]